MGIIQEKRVGAPQPEVHETDYGATFVKAATEKSIEPEVEIGEKEEAPEPSPVVENTPAPAKKKGGRPKKQK